MINITVPIYYVDIKLITDRQEYDDEVGDDKLSHGYEGVTTQQTDDDGGLEIVIGVFDNKMGTLIHEICHTALMICAERGFNAHDGNGEPFCYLVDYLFDQFKHCIDI